MKLFELIKNRPGLSFLILILGAIWVTSLRLGYYLVGWDNYSSYFNVSNNLFRTFFHTWREHRGLGVPSDSEVVDIFRQAFFFVLQPVVPVTLLDQFYMLLCLTVGAVLMYVFANMLIGHNGRALLVTPGVSLDRAGSHSDVVGFVAAFFYIFNLNTLATFNFPIITYVTRFALLPAILLMFYLLMQKGASWKLYLLFVLVTFLTSGSYITATILITVLMLLFLFGIFQGKLKRFLMILVLYLALQAFWLLPFFNYTLQKSSIMRLAPNFISANETQLNKGVSFYDLQKQLVLYPNFFDTEFDNIGKTQKLRFHPLALSYNQNFQKIVLLIFPIFYVLGTLIILYKFRSSKRLLWLPLTCFLFLFLSLKEYSVFGFLYSFLNHLSPYFGVLFRFGDTKFHVFMAFSGSILASLAFIYISQFLKRPWIYIVLFIFCVPTILVFNEYFKGNFIGSFMYNKIPDSYFEAARVINYDQDTFRVLGLPFNEDGYWNSYSWGMVGSSFMHYMLNHSYIDKTFEPGSMENAYYDQELQRILTNVQSYRTVEGQKKAAFEFADLLKRAGVKYVILDSSIQASVDVRGILLWGRFNQASSQTMMQYLMDFDLAKEVNTFSNIRIFEVNDFEKKFSFMSELLDEKTVNFKPFRDRSGKLIEKENSFGLEYEVPKKSGKLSMEFPAQDTEKEINLVDVYVRLDQKYMYVDLFLRRGPTVNSLESLQKIKEMKILAKDILVSNQKEDLNNFISDWAILHNKKVLPIRVSVGDYVLPVPANLSDQDLYVATVGVKGQKLGLGILSYLGREFLDPTLFKTTDLPNCFGDKLKDGYQQVTFSPYKIVSQNQSSCYIYSLKNLDIKADFGEFGFDLEGKTRDLDRDYLVFGETSKPKLREAVLKMEKPNVLRVCVKERGIDNCGNLHQSVNIVGQNIYVFPLEKAIRNISDMDIFMSLKNTGFQEQELIINKMYADLYKTILTDKIEIQKSGEWVSEVEVKDGKLEIDFPQILSLSSFYFNSKREVLNLSNGVCGKGYRTFRVLGDSILSYVENCYNSASWDLNSFSSDDLYFWNVSYNLASGKFPKINVKNKINSYLDEYLSLYQGYPDVVGFKAFQEPEGWIDFQNAGAKLKKLDELKLSKSYGYLAPVSLLFDKSSSNFLIQQDSENEGVVRYGDFNVVSLPSVWSDLKIREDVGSFVFDKPGSFAYSQVLPSLWKVKIGAYNGSYALKFNEAYDKQWRIYDNVWGLVFGVGKSVESVKCDSYANCFLIDNSEFFNKDVYVFYTPERLAVAGWVLTFLTIFAVFVFILRARSETTSREDNVLDTLEQ